MDLRRRLPPGSTPATSGWSDRTPRRTSPAPNSAPSLSSATPTGWPPRTCTLQE